MSASYTYSVAGDTSLGLVSAASLDAQVRANESIPVELVGVVVTGDTLVVEFQTDLDTSQEAQLTTVIASHDGAAPPKKSILATRSDGSLRVVQEPSGSTSLMQIKGFQLQPSAPLEAGSAPQVTVLDIPVPVPLDIQGVHTIWVDEGEPDSRDYVNFTIVFPAGYPPTVWAALGLGPWPFGEATTTPMDVELLTYGDHVYLPRGGQVMSVLSYGAKTVAPPLVIRVSYFAHEVAPAAPVSVKGNLKWWLLGQDANE